ncbi:putative apyrase 6 [Glycine soja]|uniref:Putative apyrase 6 n=1 Tax=Glycine soja TaxID=3848 RepID=A0A445F128_GLYSO|nr:putative apyrase 6 [Glycine soja]
MSKTLLLGEEQGISSWVAVNYALGNLGREPQETTGIVELGGASLQVTSAKLNADIAQSLHTIRLSGVMYNLYTRSLPQLGQFALVFHLVQLEHDFVVLHWVLPHLRHESLLVLDEWGNFCKSSCYVQAYGISDICWLYLSALVCVDSDLHQLLWSTSCTYSMLAGDSHQLQKVART